MGLILLLMLLNHLWKYKEKLIESSLLKIPFPSNFFDMSVCIDVLQELPENLIPAAIREIKRVSKNH